MTKFTIATGLAAAGLLFAGPALAAAPNMTVHASPTCSCCKAWVKHLQANGFQVFVKEIADVTPVKARLGVPEELRSCHTATIGNYWVEGHVPAADIRRLLAVKPAAKGLAVPGMPIGSPGMEQGNRRDPYKVILFGTKGQSVFAAH